MNLYLRYFDNEILVHTVEEALDFLDSIPEIDVTQEIANDLREYAASESYYPKRYKVRPRVYFIVIKTDAATMQDFKDKKALRSGSDNSQYPSEVVRLNTEKAGWYEGRLDFKRVVVNHTGKCEYRDTTFSAQCKALSPIDCYNRIVAHLMERVDRRSQFPSAKGKNFVYKYLGAAKDE